MHDQMRPLIIFWFFDFCSSSKLFTYKSRCLSLFIFCDIISNKLFSNYLWHRQTVNRITFHMLYIWLPILGPKLSPNLIFINQQTLPNRVSHVILTMHRMHETTCDLIDLNILYMWFQSTSNIFCSWRFISINDLFSLFHQRLVLYHKALCTFNMNGMISTRVFWYVALLIKIVYTFS